MSVDAPQSAHPISRRTLARGAAWSLPAVAAAAAVPAQAASPKLGLQGSVQIQRSCRSSTTTMTIDGRGSYPERGLWVEGATSATKVADARLTLWFPTSLGRLGWRNLGSSQWSISSAQQDPNRPGYYAYTLTYTGFAVPFVLSLVAPAVARWAGVEPATGFVWCLLFGVLVCAASAVPVARAAARGVPDPGTTPPRT